MIVKTYNSIPGIIVLLFSLLSHSVYGQLESLSHRNYAYELVTKEAAALQSIARSEPFSIANSFKRKADDAINGEKDFLSLDLSFNQRILSDKNDILKLSIPRANSPSINLLLKKVEFISPSVKVIVPSGEKKGIHDWGVFYWGSVEGDETSSVSVSVFGNEIVGNITTKGETYTLSKMKNANEYILYQEKDLVEQPEFVCNTQVDLEELMVRRETAQQKLKAGVVNPDNCVEVHLWANGSLYQEFGNDATALANYLTAFFNQVTLIYANEHINMVLSHITVKDTNGNVVLGNNVLTGSFIMFLEYNPGGGGGGAGGPLCGGGGACYIGSQYQNSGVITYDEGIGTLAHEIGHVLGSPHTDVCFWNGNNTQLDDCGSVPGPWSAGACFDPFNPVLDGDIGTLMSYCGKNISLGLGKQPGDLMRWNVYTSDCLTPCGLACVDGNENNACDVNECYPNPIVCRANIAQRGWAGIYGEEGGACDVSLKPGETVFFDPVISEGTWSGPNGFTSNNKIIEVSDPGIYTFTFSDASCTYTKDMSVTLDICTLTSLVCNSNINNEGWTSNCHVGLAPGETANFKPENDLAGGVWSWTGPNGFSSNQQEITVSNEGVYVITYTLGSCEVSTEMRVYTCDETILSFVMIEGVTPWYMADTVDISPGQTVRFGPVIQDFQNSNLYSFVAEYSWSGPNNFTAVGREIIVTDPGTYTLSIIQATCVFTKEITVTMNGCTNPVQSFANVNNQGWEQTSWIADPGGQSVALSPTPTSGNWSWTGPNGFVASVREITVSALGTYTATYTEGACNINQEVTLVECGPNPISPSYNINNQGWTNGSFDIFIPSGEVYIKPLVSNPVNFPDFPPTWWNQPDKWLWTGPNGFSAIGFSLRVPYDKPGIYTAAMTYGPCTWSIDFNVSNCNEGVCDDGDNCTINDGYTNCNCVGTSVGIDTSGNCDPVNCGGFIVCYANINNTGWLQDCSIDLSIGDTIKFGPQTDINFGPGVWSWTGPNGFTASTREITVTKTGTYTVTFSTGTCTFTEDMIVVVKCLVGTTCQDFNICTINDAYDEDCNCTGIPVGVDTSGNCDPVNCGGFIICYANINNTGWLQDCSIDLSLGDTVNFGPQTSINFGAGVWSWTGPNGFTANSRDITVAKTGTYTVTFSTGTCTFTKDMIVVVNCSIGTTCEDNDICTINDAYDEDCNCTGTLVGNDTSGNCDPVNCGGFIICYANINNTGWLQDCSIDLSVGDFVRFGPQTDINFGMGVWSWTGPYGFTANSREITVSTGGTYVVTFSTGTCTFIQEITVSLNCVDIQVQALLEGTYDPTLGEMTNYLNVQHQILPGQTPVNILTSPTPPGQPYNTAPWAYGGTEGINWTDADYRVNDLDWVLVSFRTGTEKNTEIVRVAALMQNDGSIRFVDPCPLPSSETGPLYIVIEHRNHIGIMTPQPVDIINRTLRYDFRIADSYKDGAGYGQKQLPTGEWVMIAGDGDQTDFPGYDINGTDKALWAINNGFFQKYLNSDYNLDGDINGADRVLWSINNGIFSNVPK